jgi:alpha-aminoadipate carrier protein LysW
LDVELDEIEEGDVVACDECGTEFEVVGVEPLELARMDAEGEEDEELYSEEEEEE